MALHDAQDITPQTIPRENSQRLRNNLFFKLGVDAEKKVPEVSIREPSRGSLLGKVRLTKDKLKYKADEDEDSRQEVSLWDFGAMFGGKRVAAPAAADASSLSSSCSSKGDASSSSKSSGASAKRCTFNEEVVVCPIPKREEYSKRIKERLWLSAEDMMLNTHRNSVEFAAEGWDWRNTPEDDEMYRCLATNELIHPIHIDNQRLETQEKNQQSSA
jgi:hypothetical protein